DDLVFQQVAGAALKNAGHWPDLRLEEITTSANGAIGPERVIDMLLRIGPYGDGYGRRPEGLTLDRVRESAHGVDLGPLQPRLSEVINTKSGKIELAPPTMTRDVLRLRERMASRNGEMVLIGRRNLRTSNSFMHNLPALVKG